MTGGKIPNLALKRMLELFLKIPPLKKILEFQEIKPMIENLHDEIYQLETSNQKMLNLVLILYGRWRAKSSPKLSTKYLANEIGAKLV